jgi:hypothetical protein
MRQYSIWFLLGTRIGGGEDICGCWREYSFHISGAKTMIRTQWNKPDSRETLNKYAFRRRECSFLMSGVKIIM